MKINYRNKLFVYLMLSIGFILMLQVVDSLVISKVEKKIIDKEIKNVEESLSFKEYNIENSENDFTADSIQDKFDNTGESDFESIEAENEPEANSLQKDEISNYFNVLMDGYQRDYSNYGKYENRDDLIIRYYPKEMDGQIVYNLSKFNIYVHERPSGDRYYKYASNAMYFGDSVKSQDIKIVASYLVQNGIKLKTIKKTKYKWKARSIEIATDTSLINEPSISLKDLYYMEF
ncbi:MAG TPA: hypothetical protein ACFCUD_04765 [Cyclobacteriaceae bacterium]